MRTRMSNFWAQVTFFVLAVICLTLVTLGFSKTVSAQMLASSTPQKAKTYGVHVDLRDVVRYGGVDRETKTLADMIVQDVRANLELYNEDGLYYLVGYDKAGPRGDAYTTMNLKPLQPYILPPGVDPSQLDDWTRKKWQWSQLPEEPPVEMQDMVFNMRYPKSPTRPVVALIRSLKNGSRQHEIYNMQFEKLPVIQDEVIDGATKRIARAELLMMIVLSDPKHPNGYAFFQRFSATVDMGSKKFLERKTISEEMPVSRSRFSAEVSLIDRKIVLSDSQYGVKFAFPLGVGALDLKTASNQNRILTPLFKNAGVQSNAIMLERCSPGYFDCRPFIRLISRAGEWTSIGLHGPITKDTLQRGFVSHGCMRMRQKDLYTITGLLIYQPKSRINLNVDLYAADPTDHPYPIENGFYYRVKNYGTPEAPITKLDGDGLVETELVRLNKSGSEIPLHLLYETPEAQLALEGTGGS